MKAELLALGAILLWASLATLATELKDIPPFLLTGIGLIIGSLVAIPLSRFNLRSWKIPARTLAIGVYGLFGFHLMLFIALRTAPAVSANLVNYLWPLLLVLLAPLFSSALKLSLRHVIAGLAGFAGAALAILSQSNDLASFSFEPGYLFAFIAAVIWASYSLLTTKVAAFPTAAIGLFALVSGALALVAHFILEQPVEITGSDWLWLVLLGLGPLGGAFYFWDAALKIGDPQRLGLLAFLTPLLSTALLVSVSGSSLSPQLALAAALIVGGAVFGTSSKSKLK
jgi:drug/metabolite transporter (DMT)-like permease